MQITIRPRAFNRMNFVAHFVAHFIGPTPSRQNVRSSASQKRRRAFTLVELLRVLTILGILAAIVVPKFTGRTEQARITAARTQISTFQTALSTFELDNGYFPRTLQDL